MTQNILTLDEAADYLRISSRTLWDQVQHGRVPSFRAGRQHRFSRAALDEWIRGANAKFDEAAINDKETEK